MLFKSTLSTPIGWVKMVNCSKNGFCEDLISAAKFKGNTRLYGTSYVSTPACNNSENLS